MNIIQSEITSTLSVTGAKRPAFTSISPCIIFMIFLLVNNYLISTILRYIEKKLNLQPITLTVVVSPICSPPWTSDEFHLPKNNSSVFSIVSTLPSKSSVKMRYLDVVLLSPLDSTILSLSVITLVTSSDDVY